MEVKDLEFRVFLPERACQPRGHNQQLRLEWDVPQAVGTLGDAHPRKGASV